jgi:hypothetical protein
MVKASELNDRSIDHARTARVHCGDLKSHEIVVEHLNVSIPVLSPVTTYSSYLLRHEINSPREPEDLFLLTRKHYNDSFEASYPVEPPSSMVTDRCLY